MNYPFQITINDHDSAWKIKHNIQIGHYFVFIKKPTEHKSRDNGRLLRLVQQKSFDKSVVPLANELVQLDGITITPEHGFIEPIACLVADRDLYRAEQDVVHLFVAVPNSPKQLNLLINYNGAFLSERKVELSDAGVAIENFAMLLPGRYEAQLSIEGNSIGTMVSFTVADYTLAPLSARLISHSLKRESNQLWFELFVESYQKPFADDLIVTLVEEGQVVAEIGLLALSPGRYAAGVKIAGDGPFRLRLVAADDAELVAEVAIHGSRKVEREVTVINELGQEKCFSMMPEAKALSLRGGYLTDGEFINSSLIVEEIVTKERLIKANTDVDSLVLVILDLMSGEYSVQNVGNVTAGNYITVQTDSPFCNVFMGAFIYGQPFEGYTSFINPSSLHLSIEAPETIRPREDLILRLISSDETKTIQVLLSVRDQRLTATDKPAVSLGAAAKRGINAAINGMDERTFTNIDEIVTIHAPAPKPKYSKNVPLRVEDDSLDKMENVLFDDDVLLDCDLSLDSDEDCIWMDCEEDFSDDNVGLSLEDCDLSLDVETKPVPVPVPVRSDFPEILFYDIVSVNGKKDVVIPLSDSLGSFSIETFAICEGDWIQNQSTIVIDKPVRVDLELPPVIYPNDKIIGQLRAIANNGQALISLTCNGKTVALCSGEPIDYLRINTPAFLEFYVSSGIYLASVEDISTGETDSIKLVVGKLGKFKYYAKELALLLKDESINLEDAISLRILPSLDSSFESLLTATADYTHLCCEQTAAKILAATIMYLTAKTEKQRKNAEQIILAGIAREQKMIRPGLGFTMYPDSNYISEYYSTLAVRYLWELNLDEIPDISKQLTEAVCQAYSMADEAAKAHKMRIPDKIQRIEDAYIFVKTGKKYEQAMQLIDSLIDFSGDNIQLKQAQHAVSERSTLAYAAACLIAIGYFGQGIKLANQVTRQFNEQGRLYSTVDSVAAIALMIQLIKSRLIKNTRLRVNGNEITVNEAVEIKEEIKSIKVLEGVAAVEVTQVHEENWDDFTNKFPVEVSLRNSKNQEIKQVQAGKRLDLVIFLPNGYQAGDLVHIALPACLAWIQGGGKVKIFSLDFEAKNKLRIPLLVTSKVEEPQHFAVCVRNMFEEERASNPGLLTVG